MMPEFDQSFEWKTSEEDTRDYYFLQCPFCKEEIRTPVFEQSGREYYQEAAVLDLVRHLVEKGHVVKKKYRRHVQFRRRDEPLAD